MRLILGHLTASASVEDSWPVRDFCRDCLTIHETPDIAALSSQDPADTIYIVKSLIPSTDAVHTLGPFNSLKMLIPSTYGLFQDENPSVQVP